MKTIDDLEFIDCMYIPSDIGVREILKQSAIEDIKDILSSHLLIQKGRNIGFSIFEEEKKRNNFAIISYIKMKFNITEDDLK